MLLAVNIGNTHIRMGLFRDDALEKTWTLRTDPHRTSDEYAMLFAGMFREAGFADSIDAAVCASVVPPLTGAVREALAQLVPAEPLLVHAGLRTGMTIGTEHPEELGADLLANAVAAYHTYHDDCIVVDFGTALSFVVTAADGTVEGVSIAPGVQGALESLISDTAQLFQVELATPPSVLGKNTIQSIQSGIIHGYAGLTNGIIDTIHAETGRSYRIVATGGLSHVYGPLLSRPAAIEAAHTLNGLRLIYEMN